MSRTNTRRDRETIGLIGAGLMGGALAERLVGAGFGVRGWDLAERRRAALRKTGGEVASGAAEVVASCERVVLSLPSDREVRDVLCPNETTLHRGQIIVDTSTGDPEMSAALGRRLARRGVSYLDATISGNSSEVREGSVLVMAGGTRRAFTRCRDLWACFAREVVLIGPCGSGSSMKLVTNLVLGLNRAALAEGLRFAGALELDAAKTVRVLLASAAYSRIMDAKAAKMVRGDFRPQAKLSQHLKDVRLILATAGAAGARLPLSRVHRRLLEKAVRLGFGDADNSAIIKAWA